MPSWRPAELPGGHAVLERGEQREPLRVARDEFAQAAEDLGAPRRLGAAPALECRARGAHRALHVGRAGQAHLVLHAAGGRVHMTERRAAAVAQALRSDQQRVFGQRLCGMCMARGIDEVHVRGSSWLGGWKRGSPGRPRLSRWVITPPVQAG